MNAGAGFRLGGTSIDRAGGLLRLRALADRLAETRAVWHLSTDERERDFVLLVVDTATGEILETLIEVRIASSTSVREDQLDQLIGDELALAELLRAEVDRRTFERLPESEKRLLDGNR